MKKGTLILIIVLLVLWFFGGNISGLAPQSIWKSIWTGKDAPLLAPPDLKSEDDIRNIGGHAGNVLIGYISSEDGKYRIKRYSPWGLLEGSYVVVFPDKAGKEPINKDGGSSKKADAKQ